MALWSGHGEHLRELNVVNFFGMALLKKRFHGEGDCSRWTAQQSPN